MWSFFPPCTPYLYLKPSLQRGREEALLLVLVHERGRDGAERGEDLLDLVLVPALRPRDVRRLRRSARLHSVTHCLSDTF